MALLRLAITLGAGAPAGRAWRLPACLPPCRSGLVAYLLMVPLVLVSTWRQVQGPQLTSTDLAQPLPDLKLQLRASLVSNFAALRN